MALRTYDNKTDFPQPGSPRSRIEIIGTSPPSIDAAIISRCATVEVDRLGVSVWGSFHRMLGIELAIPTILYLIRLDALAKTDNHLMFLKASRRGCKSKQAVSSWSQLRLKSIRNHKGRSTMAKQRTPYSEWSQQSLVERVEHLEKQLREQTNQSVLLVRIIQRFAKLTLRYKAASSTARQPSPPSRPKNARVNREFDPSKYATRLIALKFAYLGQNYNGLEYHPHNKTPLPTVEETLWKALNKGHLIFPTPDPSKHPDEVNWDGCEYSKCGRTDRGVSAFGQVVGIRVRSNRPLGYDQDDCVGNEVAGHSSFDNGSDTNGIDAQALEASSTNGSTSSSTQNSAGEDVSLFDPINDEIPYPQVLNRLLPPDIRVLAWCPSPPAGFSARFACKERRYKYFFTQPAFSPSSNALRTNQSAIYGSPDQGRREGLLNIQAMREAAKKFEGLHDFRNFCKLDASKQIKNFQRRIFFADIEELDPQKGPVGYVDLSEFREYHDTLKEQTANGTVTNAGTTPKIYTFTLHGSAFLWHQVRHMVAILFLVGQRLESPNLVDEMLDVGNSPLKPQYEMADDAPLVLWDCIFPQEGSENREDALEWIYVGDYTGNENGITKASGAKSNGKHGPGGVVDEMWKIWRHRKIDEILAGTLLDTMVGQGKQEQRQSAPRFRGSQQVFAGGDGPRLVGRYTPVLQRPRMESVEVINARYAQRKNALNIDRVEKRQM